MHYTLFLTSAALAQLVLGHALEHQHDHNRIHAGRDVVWEVDTAYATVVVTEYVTAGASPQSHGQHGHSPSSSPASSTPPADSTPTTSSVYSPPPAVSSSTSSVYTPPPPPPSSTPTSVAPVETPTSSSSSASSTYVAPAPSSSEVANAYSPPASSYVAPTTFATSSSSSAPAPSSSAAASASGISSSSLTPNGKKAGLSGYIGIQNKPSFNSLAPHISWYSDYTANTPSTNGVKGVGMLWGASGSPCGGFMSDRLNTFESLVSDSTPDIMFGFYEPDCTCTMSSDMTTTDAAVQWDALLAPLKLKGTVLGSPSMCKQYDETFLTPFEKLISTPWDVTSIHINKPSLAEAQKVVEYYVNKYNKPVWVSEFACVNDQPGWSPCTDQTQVNTFINDVVTYFENSKDVVAYAPSNGEGLGTVWPLTDSSTGELTTSGQTYLNAIKAL